MTPSTRRISAGTVWLGVQVLHSKNKIEELPVRFELKQKARQTLYERFEARWDIWQDTARMETASVEVTLETGISQEYLRIDYNKQTYILQCYRDLIIGMLSLPHCTCIYHVSYQKGEANDSIKIF